MIFKALEAIRFRFTINIFASTLLSLVFSSQLMIFSWADSVFGQINDSVSKSQQFSYRIVFSGLMIVSVSSAITVINYILVKRKTEFRSYIVCGADKLFILKLKLSHVFLIVVVSEAVGSLFYYSMMRFMRLTARLLPLFYVYIIFMMIVFLEIIIKHFFISKGAASGIHS